MSKYTFNYPVDSGVVEWRGTFGATWSPARGSALWTGCRAVRMRVGCFGGLVAGECPAVPAATNISNAMYQEIPSVPLPGRGVLGGSSSYSDRGDRVFQEIFRAFAMT